MLALFDCIRALGPPRGDQRKAEQHQNKQSREIGEHGNRHFVINQRKCGGDGKRHQNGVRGRAVFAELAPKLGIADIVLFAARIYEPRRREQREKCGIEHDDQSGSVCEQSRILACNRLVYLGDQVVCGGRGPVFQDAYTGHDNAQINDRRY